MGIYERRNPSGQSVWYIEYRSPDGQRVRKKIGSKRQAELALAKQHTLIFEEEHLGIKSREGGFARGFNGNAEYSGGNARVP